MVEKSQNMKDLWELLKTIPDPEIPVIDIVELGIVRDAQYVDAQHVKIWITPTYSACPAMYSIEEDIVSLFQKEGLVAEVITQLSPVWTTDWITEEAREKLRVYGIAPPDQEGENWEKPVLCPRCQSSQTKMISRFGSTLCKASYQCESCLEPFDYFKCH